MTRRTLPGRWSSEAQFQAAVAKYLDTVLDPAHARWTHIPSSGKRSAVTGAILKRHGLKRGWPDCLIIWTGHVGMIELKSHKGVVTTEQVEMAHWCELRRIPYWVCRTMEEVESALRVMNVPTRLTPWRVPARSAA